MSGKIMEFAEALEAVLEHAANVRLPAMEPLDLLRSLGRDAGGERGGRSRSAALRSRDARRVRGARGGVVCLSKRLRILGQVRAGVKSWSSGAIAGGTAIEIMTGAPAARRG